MITSSSNERIKQVTALIKKHRERKKQGLFTAEGIKIFTEAGREDIAEIYVSESFLKENEDLLSGREPVVVRDDVFAKMCDTQTPQGILTVLRRPEHTTEEILANADRGPVVILEDVQDPGNVGTIIRTAEGAGAAGIILTAGCADIYSPKTIRSTMGSVLRVPAVYTEDLIETVKKMKEAGITLYAAHLNGKQRFDEQEYENRCALLIGNEARGLSETLSEQADVRIRIPMEGRLDSLNAAVAAGILLYTVYSKRSSRKM